MASLVKFIKQNRFSIFILALEVIFLIFFGAFVDYVDQDPPLSSPAGNGTEAGANSTNSSSSTSGQAVEGHESENSKTHRPDHHAPKTIDLLASYPAFQDIHTMMFIGFGFLMVFIKRYSFSGVGLNLLIGAVVLQWATLTGGWILHFEDGKIRVDLITLIGSEFAAATVLISFGAVLGKTSPMQLVIMALIEIVVFQANELFVFYFLKASDIGDSMVVHAFGAYFGLSVSLILGRPDPGATKEKLESVYNSDVFAMIGTVFLWLFWPSFNSATAIDEGQYRAVINTYFALAASAVVTFAISALVCRSKFDMVHIQNSTLAGGVAVGTMADMVIRPWGAILIGSVAAVISVLGYHFVTPFLSRKLRLHDTCGVHNLHGMPALLSGIGAMVPAALATEAIYGKNLYDIFPALADGRTPQQQAAYQLAALAVSIGMGVFGGIITGFILRLPLWNQPFNDEIFDDASLWHLPADVTTHVITGHQENSGKRNDGNAEEMKTLKASAED